MTNFEKLKSEWYKKLQDSGFVDIENKDGSLKNSTDPRTISRALQDKESREAYYETGRNFLAEYNFLGIERKIWHGHIEGQPIRSIARRYGLTFYKVRTTIIKLQKLAGLRK